MKRSCCGPDLPQAQVCPEPSYAAPLFLPLISKMEAVTLSPLGSLSESRVKKYVSQPLDRGTVATQCPFPASRSPWMAALWPTVLSRPVSQAEGHQREERSILFLIKMLPLSLFWVGFFVFVFWFFCLFVFHLNLSYPGRSRHGAR